MAFSNTTVIAAGDYNNSHANTQALFTAAAADAVTSYWLGLGDHAYQCGTYTPPSSGDFGTSFKAWFDAVVVGAAGGSHPEAQFLWPTPGSHDWGKRGSTNSPACTNGSLSGYASYFGTAKGMRITASDAGETGYYYSHDLLAHDGSPTRWKLIALDVVKAVGAGAAPDGMCIGCWGPNTRPGGQSGNSGQYDWLASRLADAVAADQNVIVTFAHPYYSRRTAQHYSSGGAGEKASADMVKLIQSMRPGRALILSSHQHNYQRSKQLNPNTGDSVDATNGIWQFVAGVAAAHNQGYDFNVDAPVDALFQASRDTAGGAQSLSGALTLVLKDTSVDFTYKTDEGTTRDSGTLTLNAGAGGTPPPAAAPVQSSGPTDGSIQAPGAASFGWNVVATATGYKYSIDGAATVDNGATRAVTTGALGAGTHTFEVWAYNAGGDGPHLLITWTVTASGVPTVIPTVQVVQTTPAWSSADKEIGRVDAICFDPVNQILYVGGNFHGANSVKTKAGALVTRNYIFAIDWTTQELVASWAPEANGRIYSIFVSADGSKVYVGGDFTSIGSTPQTRRNFACLNPAIGGNAGTVNTAHVADLAFNGTVHRIVPADGGHTLFLGGNFTAPATTGRRLCKLDVSGSAAAIVTTWKPLAGTTTGTLQQVKGLFADPLTNRLVVAGDWTSLNGAVVNYIGCIRQDGNGESLSWTDHPGDRVLDLAPSSDGLYVYIGTVNDHLEKLRVSDGARQWFETTDGNVQAVAYDAAGFAVGGMHGDCIGNAAGAASGSYTGGSCSAPTGLVRHKAFRVAAAGGYDPDWDPSLTGGTGFGVLGVWAAHVSGGVTWLGGDFKAAQGADRNRLVAIQTGAVQPPPSNARTVIDSFTRTVAAGSTFGNADTGELWVKTTGNTNGMSVDGAAGVLGFPTPGTYIAHLVEADGVTPLATSDFDIRMRFKLDVLPIGANMLVSILARMNADGSGYYRGRLTITPAGAITGVIARSTVSVETTLLSQSIGGLTIAADTYYWLRLRGAGGSSVALDLKLWQDGTTEPGPFNLSTTDVTPPADAPSGALGFRMQAVAAVSNPLNLRMSDYTAAVTQVDVPPPPPPQPDAITPRIGSTMGEGTTSAAVAVPSSTQVGDQMIAHVTVLGSATITPPAGWTLLAPVSADGTALAVGIYGRVMVAGDLTATFTTPGSSITVELKSFGGVDPVTPVRVAAATHSAGTAQVALAGSALTGLKQSDEILTFFSSAAGPRPWPDAGGLLVGVQPVPTDWATQATVAAIEAVALRKIGMASSMVPWDCHTGIANGDFGAGGRGPAVDFANNRVTYNSWPRPRPGANGAETSWQSVFGSGSDPTPIFNQIAAGNFDGIIDGNANAYKAFGHPIILRLFHEMNGGGIIWGIGNSTQQGSYAAAYNAACKRIIDRTRAIAKNVYFHWNPQNFATVPGAAGARDNLYWDDAHADAAGTELYMSPGDTATSVLQNVSSNGQTYPAIYTGYGLASPHGKILGNGEGGNRYQGSSDTAAAAARTDSLQALSGFPDWRFMVWWNGNGSNGNSDVTTQPAACQSAFANWLATARTKPALTRTFFPIGGPTQEYEVRRSLGGAAQTNIGAGQMGATLVHAPQQADGSSSAVAAATYGYGLWAAVTLALVPSNPNPPPPPPPPPPPGETPTTWWCRTSQNGAIDESAQLGRTYVGNRLNVNISVITVKGTDKDHDGIGPLSYRNSNSETSAPDPKAPISWALVASGGHDADYLIPLFNLIKADPNFDGSSFEKTFLYSPHHEQTVNSPPQQIGWSVNGFPTGAGTVPEYVDFYRHQRDLADSMGLTVFKKDGTPNGGNMWFVYCPLYPMMGNPKPNAGVPHFDPDGDAAGARTPAPPGISYYDIFGMDFYSAWDSTKGALKWGADAAAVFDNIRNYALAKGKDFILPECGIGDSTDPASHAAKASFLRAMRSTLKGYGSVSPGVCRAIFWTPIAFPPPENYTFTSSPESLQAAIEMANDVYFMAGLFSAPPTTQTPVAAITSPFSGTTISGSSVTVTALVEEQNGGIASAKLQVNNGAAIPMTPVSVDANGNGTYTAVATLNTGAQPGAANTLQVQAVDQQTPAVMATSPTMTIFAVAGGIDVDGPVLTVTSPAGGADATVQGANGTAFSISGTVSDASGLTDLAITKPDLSVVHPTVAGDGSFSLAVALATGANAFQIDATDASPLHNITSSAFIITLAAPDVTDVTGPTLSVTTPAADLIVAGPVGSLYNVHGTAFDPSGIQTLTVNGVAVPVVGGAFSTIIALASGANPVAVVATDNSANHNQTTVTHTITLVETLGPTLVVSAPAADQTIQGAAGQAYTVAGNVTSSHGLSRLTVNGIQAQIGVNGDFTFPILLSGGQNTISVVATDAQVVPQSTAIVRTITLDTGTPPADGDVILSADEKRIQDQITQRGFE